MKFETILDACIIANALERRYYRDGCTIIENPELQEHWARSADFLLAKADRKRRQHETFKGRVLEMWRNSQRTK